MQENGLLGRVNSEECKVKSEEFLLRKQEEKGDTVSPWTNCCFAKRSAVIRKRLNS